jgi:hypothetical protein
MVGQDVLIVVATSRGKQPVQITKDALSAFFEGNSIDASRLNFDKTPLMQIARAKLESGQVAFDGRIWVTQDDVRAWRGRH